MARLSDEEKAARAAAREAKRKAELDAWVAKTVAEAPPLSQAQIDQIATLLKPELAKGPRRAGGPQGE
jgi:hypothetical protein